MSFNWAEIEYDGRIVTAHRWQNSPRRWNASRIEVEGHVITNADDPRLVIHNEKLYCTYDAFARSLGHKICITSIDEKHETHVVRYGASVEKNWCFFSLNGTLYAVYDLSKGRVVEFSKFQVCDELDSTPLSWDHGRISGGTPPVLVGDRLTMFFHSWQRQQWHGADKDNYYVRVYHVGYCELDSKPPFAVRCYSKRPIFIKECGEYPCVFPCSARRSDDGWQLTCGFNDHRSGRVLVSDRAIDRSMGCRRSTLVGV